MARRDDDPFYDDENQRRIDTGLEFEPRCCFSCGRPLTNGELGDQCEPCHNLDHFGDTRGRDGGW